MQAGPEMDRAVATLCKSKTKSIYFVGKHPCWDDHDSDVPFRPSADVRAAFFAAEQVDLFTHPKHGINLYVFNGEWHVDRFCDDGGSEISRATTPAEAICRAILALTPTPAAAPPAP